MSALVFRTSGPWGAGKGSPLTKEEADGNIFELAARIASVESEGILPKDIYSITVIGNRMTITLNDLTTTFGPFDLPMAAFSWTDEWQPNHEYQLYDVFLADQGVYLVGAPHTSASEFDPEESNSEGDLYRLIFPFPSMKEIAFFFPGVPGTGIADGESMFSYLAINDFYLEQNLPLSLATLRVAPADAQSYEVLKNDSSIGWIDFPSGETEGIFTFTTPTQFTAGDRLRVLRNAVDLDGAARDLNVTFKAMKGTI